jgi:hypothetical protein
MANLFTLLLDERTDGPRSGIIEVVRQKSFACHSIPGVIFQHIDGAKRKTLKSCVAFWEEFEEFLTPAVAVRLANLSFAALKNTLFAGQVKRATRLLEKYHIQGSIDDIAPRFSEWAGSHLPADAGVERLLEWCCGASDTFQDEFLAHFPLIFSSQFDQTDLRGSVAGLYVQGLCTHGIIEQIESFVNEIKRVYMPWARSAQNREQLDAIFTALTELESGDFAALAPMILRILGDGGGSKSEMEFVREAFAKMRTLDVLNMFDEVVKDIPMRLKRGQVCSEAVGRQIEHFFANCGRLADRFRSRLPLSESDLVQVFPEETAEQLRRRLFPGSGDSSEDFSLID